MDNGRGQEIGVKEPTEQINRAQQLGWQVLDGEKNGQNELAGGVSVGQAAAEIVGFETTQGITQEAAQEIAQDEDKLEHSAEYVGTETPLQVAERLESEQENLRNENDPKRDNEAKLVNASQEKIAQAAMGEVESLLKEKQVMPAKIEEIWRKRGDAILNSYENPHPIGKGNG